MPDDTSAKTSNALIHIDGDSQAVGEAAKLFLQIVNDAVGGWLKPWQIRRVADAEADAKLTHAMADIRATSLQKRAAQRWLAEEEAKQANMEAITAKAVPHVKPDAQPGKIERDWLTNFFDKSRLTSDEDMQELWAKILAGEANAPGKFSKQTVNLAGHLEKRDAEQFNALCRFAWSGLGEVRRLVLFNIVHPIYRNGGLESRIVDHLAGLGLVTVDRVAARGVYLHPHDNPTPKIPISARGRYGAREVSVTSRRYDLIRMGQVHFTTAGLELSEMCPFRPVEGYFEFCLENWNASEAVAKELEPSKQE